VWQKCGYGHLNGWLGPGKRRHLKLGGSSGGGIELCNINLRGIMSRTWSQMTCPSKSEAVFKTILNVAIYSGPFTSLATETISSPIWKAGIVFGWNEGSTVSSPDLALIGSLLPISIHAPDSIIYYEFLEEPPDTEASVHPKFSSPFVY
jgi:hypothetical protein